MLTLPLCSDVGFFLNRSGVVGSQATAGFLPFTGLMSTLGSVFIKSCRNIFTTVQKQVGYLVKLVPLHSEGVWGGGRARGVGSGRTLSGFSFSLHPAQVACVLFLFISAFWGGVPPASRQGETRAGTVSCGSCFPCLSTLSPLLHTPTSEYIKFRGRLLKQWGGRTQETGPMTLQRSK